MATENNTTATATAPPTTTTTTTTNTAVPSSTTPQPQAQIPAATTTAQTLSFSEKLDAGEQHWAWKLSLRVLLLVVAIIGIGCIGWAVQTANSGFYNAYMYDQYYLCWALITFGISIIWVAICILVLLLRSPPRPVHPGVAVGMDLILWLGYIVTTMFAAFAVVGIIEFGADGFINKYSSSGYYTQASNGTWVYNATEYMQEFGRTRDCAKTTKSSYYDSSYGLYFKDCAEEDAFVNALWQASKKRAGVVMTGTVCQGLGFLLHFVLFVWACVDTHRRNRSKTSGDAEKLAAEIIGRMVRDGAIVQAPGQAQAGNNRIGGQVYGNYQGGWQGQGQGQQPYTLHQGPPPPVMMPNQIHPAMRGQPNMAAPMETQAQRLPSIVEHYGNEKGRGLGGPGPAPAPPAPIVEHYGNEKAGSSSQHAI